MEFVEITFSDMNSRCPSPGSSSCVLTQQGAISCTTSSNFLPDREEVETSLVSSTLPGGHRSMIRESTRRRRRSRSVSPGRGVSKRARSRSRDRRGRNTGAARDANRIVDVPRRDKRLRDDRRMTRSREREMDTRHAPNSLYASGGGGSGMGGGRERDVQVRELPVGSSGYRGGGGGVGGGGMLGGRGVVVHHQPPMYAAGMDMRGGVPDHRGGGNYGGVSGGVNGHARGGGYAVTLPRGRNDDRERERERELQRERDRRERERERERGREKEREKERKLLREREERARQREARAAADLRTAEALRRDTARLRDEAAAHARASGGTGGARGASGGGGSGNGNGTRVGLGEGGIGGGGPINELTESGDRMPPRGRTRDRGRERMAVRSQKGTYMKKDQVDALFLKVIKKMAEDKSRFPCSASLINDRMKQASVEDYNVANSEYMRFANVLARFEKDKIVGTTKSKDRLQILWTKFSPLDTSAAQDTRGMASTDSRRNASGESRNARVIVRGGPLKLYFCAADETKFAGTGGEGTVTTAASPYADIIALLQARGEVMTSHDQKKRVGEAVAVPPQAAETKTEAVTAEDKLARLAAEASGESAATEYGAQNQGGGEGVSSSAGKGDKVTGKGGAELEKGEVREPAEEQEEGGISTKEEAVAGREGGVKGEGDEGVVVVNSGAESAIKDPEKGGKDRLTAREMFDKEVVWLRSSHALVAEISTPSTGVGFKIALMTHQRFKPCLGLIRKSADGNSKDSQSTASALSPMLRGSANLEIHEYTEPSDIDEILDEWIERRILRKRDRDDSRRGGRRGRGDSREGPIKKLKEVDGSVRGRAGGDSGDGVDENAREKLDTGGGNGGSNGAGVRRGVANDHDHEEDENMDDQSLVGGRDSGTGVGGEGAESFVSDDEDDDHEEVEDATGAHDAATAVAAGGSEGAGAGLGLGQTGEGVDEMEVTDYGSAPEHGEVDVEVGVGAEDHEEVSGGGDDSEKSSGEAVV